MRGLGSKEKAQLEQLLEVERRRMRPKRDIALEFYRAITQKAFCTKFIRSLKMAVAKTKKLKEIHAKKVTENTSSIKIDKNERLVE